MLTKFNSRFGAPGVIAVIALVFAMVGGAWAAGGGLSGKQKKEVKKIARTEAKKFATQGPPGAQGPVGAAGAAGSNGKDGSNGTNGSNGSNGKSVVVADENPGVNCSEGGISVEVESSGSEKFVCNGQEGLEGEQGEQGIQGEQGDEGPEGSPWTAGGTVPSGKSLFGTWSAGPLAEGQFGAWVSVSFPIPLTAGPTVNYMGEEADPTAACPGTFESPKATAGNLCLYRSGGFGLEYLEEENPETGISAEGAGKAGANLFFTGEEFQSARGVWVVTAP